MARSEAAASPMPLASEMVLSGRPKIDPLLTLGFKTGAFSTL